ncbi:hypothetical protein KKF34_15020 [Myxococcota bacterium]|nr:hypothetical protein [Myxococcota bacterium]MBU1379512.1 hypothetical protein [Myxococcota bacterium]MBU1498188.1 hypothetical protein [Myxococcota bacterium]
MISLKLKLILIFILINLPGIAQADIASYMLRYRDGRGTSVHAVPIESKSVGMEAERVVLIPFYDLKTSQVMILTYVWYDMISDKDISQLQVGFPELKALVNKDLSVLKRPWTTHDDSEYSWDYPTITGFRAWSANKQISAISYSGTGMYRRWFGFNVSLPANKKVRIHNAYISNPGKLVVGDWNDENEKRGRTTKYFIHYILHTGALWHGNIGNGEVYLYQQGELHQIKKFSNVKPLKSDDIHIMLDSKLVEWDRKESEPQKQWANKIPDLKLRFPFASTTKIDSELEAHAGFAVDGDPTTFWTSKKGSAIGSYLQLPSNPDRGLMSVSITPGTQPGTVRPSSILVHCLNHKRHSALGQLVIPKASGSMTLKLSRPARCDAIRIEVKGIHGLKTAAVSIAEITQEFKKKSDWKPRTAPLPKDYTGRDVVPMRKNEMAFDTLRYDEVRWSLDGKRLHYQMYRENLGKPINGVAFGYFIETVTGRKLTTYRITRTGTLPGPIEKEWETARPLSEGLSLLKRGWGPVMKAKKNSPESWTVQLIPEFENKNNTIKLIPTSAGFSWKYKLTDTKNGQKVKFTIRFRNKSEKKYQLSTQPFMVDTDFASRHRKIWKARRRFYMDLVEIFENQWSADGMHSETHLPKEVWKHLPEVWHRLFYPYDEANNGDASFYWEPEGRAVAVMWRHQTDMSSQRVVESSSKFPKGEYGNPKYFLDSETDKSLYGNHISHCARNLLVMVCPWDRHDDSRYTPEVTIRSFVLPAVTKKLSNSRPENASTISHRGEKRTTHSRPGCSCEKTPGKVGKSGSIIWLIFAIIGGALFLIIRSKIILMIPLFIIGSIWIANNNVSADDSMIIKLTDFADIPIPGGGRSYAPDGMEGVLFMAHYRTPEGKLSALLRTALKSNGWIIQKDKDGEQHPNLTSNFREFVVKKGKIKIFLAAYRYSQSESILFVTTK